MVVTRNAAGSTAVNMANIAVSTVGSTVGEQLHLVDYTAPKLASLQTDSITEFLNRREDYEQLIAGRTGNTESAYNLWLSINRELRQFVAKAMTLTNDTPPTPEALKVYLASISGGAEKAYTLSTAVERMKSKCIWKHNMLSPLGSVRDFFAAVWDLEYREPQLVKVWGNDTSKASRKRRLDCILEQVEPPFMRKTIAEECKKLGELPSDNELLDIFTKMFTAIAPFWTIADAEGWNQLVCYPV